MCDALCSKLSRKSSQICSSDPDIPRAGEHRNDARLHDYSAEVRAKDLAPRARRWRAVADRLSRFPPKTGSKVDARLLRTASTRNHELAQSGAGSGIPSVHSLSAIHALISREFRAAGQRLWVPSSGC